MQPIFFKKSTRKSAKKTKYDKKSGILCYKAIFFGNKITFFNFYYYLCIENILILIIMNIETIGSWAGLVWNALNDAESLNIKQLKKATKLKEKELYAAFGWLGREGKLNITEVEGEIVVALNK